MKNSTKTIMIILIYLLGFIGVGALVSYFTDLVLFDNIQIQFYIGIGAFALLVLLIILVLRSENENEEKPSRQKNEEKTDTVENESLSLTEGLQAVQTATLSDDNMHYQECQDQIETLQSLSENQETVCEAVLEPAVKEEKTAAENQPEVIQFEVPSDTLNIPIQKIENQKVDANLSETAIMQIRSSKNSYIDENGLPKLVITEAIHPKEVKKASAALQKEKEAAEIKQLSDEQALEAEEKNERLNSFLEKVIILVILAILCVGAYLAMSLFGGGQ